MSLFKRINDNIRANLNAMLDKAEDPVLMLNQYLRDMEDDIADAEGAVAKQLAVVKRLKGQYDEAAGMADKREEQALAALEKEREDLARKALEDKKIHKAMADDYHTQFERSQATAEQLKNQLREMKAEYEKLRARRDTMAARAMAAKARKQVVGAMSGHDRDSARRNFDRMEERILQWEAEAEVAVDLKGGEESLDSELAALNGSEVEKELEDLKARLREQKS